MTAPQSVELAASVFFKRESPNEDTQVQSLYPLPRLSYGPRSVLPALRPPVSAPPPSPHKAESALSLVFLT